MVLAYAFKKNGRKFVDSFNSARIGSTVLSTAMKFRFHKRQVIS